MASVTAGLARVRALRIDERVATPALLLALALVSIYLRTRILDAGFWIDEGISVGIAHHPLLDIPGLLHQDGSPPLYYLLLHVWIGVFGDSETSTHVLSLGFALGCIPAAYATGRALFGRVAGLVAAGLVAVDPYLTLYGEETRMYSLLALLSFAVAISFVRAVLERRRAWIPALVASLTALLYTHNWALFVCLALVAATAAFARDAWREAAAAAAGTAVLYAPWLATLLFQVRHTGAPWSKAPSLHDLLLAPGALIGGDAALAAIVMAAAVGVGLVRGRRTLAALALIVAVTVAVAWLFSQLSPAWATRYFAVVFAPSILIASAVLARAGRLGVVALAILLVLWTNHAPKADKSDVREVAELVAPRVHHGDLILSTHPEQTPVLRYYMGGGLHWWTPLGKVRDPRMMDWRDALDRLRTTPARRSLDAALRTVPPGGRAIVIAPIFRDYRGWQAKWTKLVYVRSRQWSRLLAHDPRFTHVAHYEANEIELERRFFKPVQADVYVRR